MTQRIRREHLPTYEVGYGKPPVHTRFRKGQSGNPSGRPNRKATNEPRRSRCKSYRLVPVRKGDRIVEDRPLSKPFTAARFCLAAQGNGPAQRACYGSCRRSRR